MYTSRSVTAFILALLSPSWGFQTHHCSNIRASTRCTDTTTSLRYTNMDAFTQDAMELLVGGTKYEMVELPDSMMSTTLWVGNLCEFITDEQLSEVFQQASEQLFVPACVARKPNMESLKYGFVAFRSEEEKEVSNHLMSCFMVVLVIILDADSSSHTSQLPHTLQQCFITDGHRFISRIRSQRQATQSRANQRPREIWPHPCARKDHRIRSRSDQDAEEWAQYNEASNLDVFSIRWQF